MGDLKGAAQETLFCLWPGQEDFTSYTDVPGLPKNPLQRDGIAAQCCTSLSDGEAAGCRRRPTKPNGGDSGNNDDCLAGWDGTFEPKTYGQTLDMCDSLASSSAASRALAKV